MLQQPEEQYDEIDLSALFSVLWQRKFFILLFVSLSTILAYLHVDKMPNVYRSSIVILLKNASQTKDALQSLISGEMTSAETTETEIQLIKSNNLLSKVIDNLNLANHPQFVQKAKVLNKTALPSENHNPRLAALEHLKANISVENKSGTELIEIAYRSPYPELAVLVVNNLGSTFIKYKEELMENKHQQGAKFIGGKLEEVHKSLKLAEAKIVKYQNEHQFADITTASALINRQLSQLHQSKDKLIAAIEQANILKQHAKDQDLDIGVLLSLAAFKSSTAVEKQRQIDELRSAFAEIKLRYGPKHPKYKAAENLMNEAEGELQQEVELQISKLNRQISIQQEQVRFFEQEIVKLTDRLNQLGTIEFDYQKLKREFEANLELYETLVRKQNETELMQDLSNSSNVILIESATLNDKPVSPKKHLILVLAMLGSFVLAVTVILVEYALGNKILQFRRLAAKYNTKVLGVVPKIKRPRKERKQVITSLNENQFSRFAEAIRSIRSTILLDKNKSKHRVIAITSISANDGKSTLSFQLSKCFAEVGQTILVDADLRYPSMAEALNQPKERPGLTNLVAKTHSFQDTIFNAHPFKFDALTSGQIPSEPLTFLEHKRFSRILNILKTKYKRVILECPPIMSVSDAFVVSKYVDTVYLVVDTNKANTTVVANVLEELAQANVAVGGLILNKVKDKQTLDKYSYYGYYAKPKATNRLGTA